MVLDSESPIKCEPVAPVGARWVAGLWLGLAATACVSLAAPYAKVAAGIHRPENVVLAVAFVGVLGCAAVASALLPLWRLLAIGLSRVPRLVNPVVAHVLVTLSGAVWLAPSAAPPLCLAAALWFVRPRNEIE